MAGILDGGTYLDFTSDRAVMTLILKILYGIYLGKCRKFTLV